MWKISTTDSYEEWFGTLALGVQEKVLTMVKVLREKGPGLGRPLVDSLKNSEYPNLKELRVQVEGHPYRIAFIFDKERIGWLLCGDCKEGSNDKDFYSRLITKAEKVITTEGI